MTDRPPLAAIDLGSNSFRLAIGRVGPGGIERVSTLKETVRLGAGLDDEGRLSAAAMQRGWDCLARFAARVRGFAPARLRAVATQTLREARNGADFLAPAERALGFAIEVISGREEARLIYGGVTRLLPAAADERRLVVDIGGRSTELVLGRGHTPHEMASVTLGSVDLSLRFFADGRLTQAALDAATQAAQAALATWAALAAPAALAASAGPPAMLADPRWDRAYGSSGTVGAIATILAADGRAGPSGRVITRAGLEWLGEELLRAGHVERLRLAGLEEERRAVIGGGFAALRAVFALAGLETMQRARGALRHGVLYELLARDAAASTP